ncbi:alpha-ketoglutarate-dependent dioxygenase AlkB [soil metagenome]
MEKNINLLPCDGIVNYYGKIMDLQEAQFYLECLLQTIAWKHDEAIIFGKLIVTKRKAAWYGDRDFDYTYSNSTKKALKWTNELLLLKNRGEEINGSTFNSCLLNLYQNGEEGVSWHSDDEKSLGPDTTIASLSFGAERKFLLKHKVTKQLISVILENGSLLVMKGSTQSNWLHSLPKTKKVSRPRVNLTFRTIVNN